MTLEPERALEALQQAVADFNAVLRSRPDASAIAIGHWTIGDVGAHVGHSFGVERDLLRGDTSWIIDELDDLTAFNEKRLVDDPERDLLVLADRIDGILTEFVDAAKNHPAGEPVVWHARIPIPAPTATAIMLSEFLVHGRDIATAADRPFPIRPEHAVMVFEGLLPLIPHYVNKEAAAGFSGCYELSMRGGTKVLWTFNDGLLTIEPPGTRTPDCRISADPVDYMLVGYGRIGRWGPIAKGKLVSWGRKPWLGMKLPGLLAAP